MTINVGKHRIGIVFSMAQSRLSRDGSPGWTSFGLDHEKVIEEAKKYAGQVRRVMLQRACGASWRKRLVGVREDGSEVWVNPLGPDDNSLPLTLAARLQDLGLGVAMHVGWPRYASGFQALSEAARMGVAVSIDSSGSSVNGWLIKSNGAGVEPVPTEPPDWFDAETAAYTSVDRAEVLERRGSLPEVHVPLFMNGDENGDNYYDHERWMPWYDRGHLIDVPLPFGEDAIAKLAT